MARNQGWQQNFYIPEHYEEPLRQLKERLADGSYVGPSFSQCMQECLQDLFKKHGISFTEKPK